MPQRPAIPPAIWTFSPAGNWQISGKNSGHYKNVLRKKRSNKMCRLLSVYIRQLQILLTNLLSKNKTCFPLLNLIYITRSVSFKKVYFGTQCSEAVAILQCLQVHLACTSSLVFNPRWRNRDSWKRSIRACFFISRCFANIIRSIIDLETFTCFISPFIKVHIILISVFMYMF